MKMNNRDIAVMFDQVADMLAIRGDQIHRVLAYRRAAESIAALSRDINQVAAEGSLTEVAGIVRGIPGKETRKKLLSGEPADVEYGDLTVPTVHLAHPGIVMRKGMKDSRNPWPRRHMEEHVPVLRGWLEENSLLA